MKRLYLLLTVFIVLAIPSYGQDSGAGTEQDALALRRISLLSELQALEARAGQLKEPLALAAAKAEIADAAWTLDKDWAQGLLREAYQLTFPREEARARLRRLPAGSLVIWSAADRARAAVRQRVMSVASRDADFAGQLVRLGAEELGGLEAHERYSELAASAAERGDKKAAADYIRQAFDAEPTQMGTLQAISDIAAQDRPVADDLIIQYIERLGSVQLSRANASDARVLLMLSMLAHPSRDGVGSKGRQIAPPSPAVMRAWVGFMLDYIARGEQSRPGFLQYSREMLLTLWPDLKRYAPELVGRFQEMEMLSRRPGDKVSWPPADRGEHFREQNEERTKSLVESGEVEPGVVSLLIDRGEVAAARKLLDRLADGPQKTDLLDKLDTKEALSFIKKGDLMGARVLAARLTKATYILQVYPPIIEKCAAAKDKPCAAEAASQAVRQLKQADATPPVLPPGTPASPMPTAREYDPALSGLCKLAQAVTPLDGSLAFEVLNEVVTSANASEVDTAQGRAGFDPGVFKSLARIDALRACQAASGFKDGLRQVVSQAAIYKWEAEELSRQAEAVRRRPPG
jgi:hypothetical protein